MERTAKSNPVVASKGATEKQLVTYRKIGGGSCIVNNRMIKPNETFRALPSDIRDAFRDLFVVVQKAEEEETPKQEYKKPEGVKETFSLVHDETSTKKRPLFHIVSNLGKQLTEESLEKEEAEQMLKAVN